MMSARSQLFYTGTFVPTEALAGDARAKGEHLIKQMNYYCDASGPGFDCQKCSTTAQLVGSRYGPPGKPVTNAPIVTTLAATPIPGQNTPIVNPVAQTTTLAALYTLGSPSPAVNTNTAVCVHK